MKQENPTLKTQELMVKIADRWREMDSDQKQPYILQRSALLVEYNKKLAEWQVLEAKAVAARGSSDNHTNDTPTVTTIPVVTQSRWAQCELCHKWRRLPDHAPDVRADENFVCALNMDPKHNSCDVVEEQWDETEKTFCYEVGIACTRMCIFVFSRTKF